jgi:hypothetical protein
MYSRRTKEISDKGEISLIRSWLSNAVDLSCRRVNGFIKIVIANKE